MPDTPNPTPEGQEPDDVEIPISGAPLFDPAILGNMGGDVDIQARYKAAQARMGVGAPNPGPGQPGHVHNADGSCCGQDAVVKVMDARTPDLESNFAPGVSNEQILDAILQLPTDHLIPWEMCELPSQGFFYPWGSPTVEVRAMGQVADKILATPRLAQDGQSIDYLLKECVRFPVPDFDPMDLLVGDRVFLLYYLRGITHGNMYEFVVTCQNTDCQKPATYSYDLNNLARTIRRFDPAMGPEPYKIVLPYLTRATGREFWVTARFVRGRDTTNMMAMRRTKKKAFVAPTIRAGRPQRPQPGGPQREIEIDETLTENLELVIQTAMGSPNRQKISALVAKMHSTDTAAIREWLREYTPGIETVVTLNCPECGQQFVVELPITESFFRPTQVR